MTVDPEDPALDARVARLCWYHTSTQPDWPSVNVDPAPRPIAESRMRMGGDEQVSIWAARQTAKALHVGRPQENPIQMELAAEASLVTDLAQHVVDRASYVSAVVREGWLIDPSDFVGDVALAQIRPPDVDVARYLKHHQHPDGLFLALGSGAIDSVEQVAVHFTAAWDDD